MEWDKRDKTAFFVCDLGDEGTDLDDWLSRTPRERFEAIEYMRQMVYGYDPATATMERVCEILDLEEL